jgi:quercetin dioxygenase-like cupin family protein
MKPYTEIKKSNVILRTFSPKVMGEELVWHRDKKDRVVEVVDGQGWFFQMDNQIPHEIKKGDIFEIKKETFHRIIKGITPLKIKIKE